MSNKVYNIHNVQDVSFKKILRSFIDYYIRTTCPARCVLCIHTYGINCLYTLYLVRCTPFWIEWNNLRLAKMKRMLHCLSFSLSF